MSNQDVFRALIELEAAGGTASLCTVVRTQGSVPRREGTKMLVYPDGRIVGTVGGGELEARVITRALELAERRETGIVNIPLVDPSQGDAGVCGGEMDVFIEPVLAEATVLVVGCGHVGKEVAFLAKWLGFRVAVTDDRVEFCSPEWLPGADLYLPGNIPEALQGFEITDQTSIAAVTRGVKADTDALPYLLGSPASYVGVIGSKRRWSVAVQELQARGVSDELLRRVHAPIGLDIGAETPREIAVSVLAEIMARRNGREDQTLRWLPPALSAQ